MKMTLLEMTQNILSRLDSTEVNSVSDTTESLQVTNIIKTIYFNMLARADMPELKKAFCLDSSTDPDAPALMTSPTNVRSIEWLKYNVVGDSGEPNFSYVTILPFQQYMDMIHSFNTTESNIESFTLNDQEFYYRNDKDPQYCCILDDYYIIFDSYNLSVDTTLQSEKTMAYGLTFPEWSNVDDFVPELDAQQFPLLLAEATHTAFNDLKQTQNPAAVAEARRQWRTLQRTKSLVKPSSFDRLPNYGR